MCGIVGCLGRTDAQEVIVRGLKALEYRGYDSAGVAIISPDKQVKRTRAEGKLVNLVEKLSGDPIEGKTGIGHTRWATHGVPSERNAHPHSVGKVSIVHNGIIENYLDLRDEIYSSGGNIKSDTDSELIAHLISNTMVAGEDFVGAVQKVIPQLKGAFAVLALCEDQPGELVAFTNGPPLIVGVDDNSFVLASDLLAIVPYTKNVFYLKEGEIFHGKGPSEYAVIDIDNKPVLPDVNTIDWNVDLVERSGYSHFMLKEIFEQPRSFARSLEPHIDLENQSVNFESLSESLSFFKSLSHVHIVACGTSFYSGRVGATFIEKMARVSCSVDIASEFRYREPVFRPNSLVILVSQSGETADTLAALRLAKEHGVKTLSVVNVGQSSIDREADFNTYMNAGVEIGVASTKAFVCSLSIFYLFSVFLGRVNENLTKEDEVKSVESILAVPAQMETVLTYDKFFREAADTLKKYKGFLYLARGVNFPIALEGALKLKELAYMHAEGYAAGEMKHGPLALIDEDMAVVVIAPKDNLYEKTISNLETAKARGGQIISIGTVTDEKLKGLSLNFIGLPKVDWSINPFLSVIPLQLLSFHVANALGHDVDQPRNLAKSVTVE